jgi:peptidylprolyl isomerase
MRGVLLGAITAFGLAGGAMAQSPEDVLVIEVAGKGTVEVELFAEEAPEHAERLRTLARDGAYDGVVFHRVIDGFMAQTGDVEFGTQDAFAGGRAGTGGSDLPDLPAEFSDVSFERCVVGMARSQSPNSANSQFFIMFDSAPHLDGQYTAVGRVVEGMDVVDSIERGQGPNGAVMGEPDYMETVRVKSEM